MKIGLVARNDHGGIAAQAWDFARELPISATLVVEMDYKGRGPSRPLDWPDPYHVSAPPITNYAEVGAFLDKVDVVLSIETFYGDLVTRMATERGIPTVRYANPELYKPEGETQVVLPSHWERKRLPNALVIEQAIRAPQERVQIRRRPLRHILHTAAPAMLDRNGTNSVIEALSHTEHNFKLTIRSMDINDAKRMLRRHKRHEIHVDAAWLSNRWDAYPSDVDLLLLPRRYAGNAMNMYEAASLGIPILTTDLEPQRRWFSEKSLVPCISSHTQAMVGGKFEIHNADPQAIAKRLDELADDPKAIGEMSTEALSFALTRSWGKIAPQWMQLFQTLCP